MLCTAIQPRCKTFKDAADQAAFLMTDDDAVVMDPKAVEKHLKADNGAGLGVVREVSAALKALPNFEPATIHAAIEAFAASKGLAGQLGKIAQPLRVALTGGTVSPPIDLTIALLGRERALGRLERALV
jgi:glutamyl-tRNA synthetase